MAKLLIMTTPFIVCDHALHELTVVIALHAVIREVIHIQTVI